MVLDHALVALLLELPGHQSGNGLNLPLLLGHCNHLGRPPLRQRNSVPHIGSRDQLKPIKNQIPNLMCKVAAKDDVQHGFRMDKTE
jgi:hypothetical protein